MIIGLEQLTITINLETSTLGIINTIEFGILLWDKLKLVGNLVI